MSRANYSREDYNHMAHMRRSAFVRIAERLGKEHEITKMMGTLAWGRHGAEQGPEGNLRTAITEAAFLNGYFDCLNHWARDHDREAQKVMLALWPRGSEKAPANCNPEPSA